MKPPLVSVITSVFNDQVNLPEAVESIQGQTFTDWEMIIVDDGSTDQSPCLAREYASRDRRIRVIALKENVGRERARNIAIEAAKGRYLAVQDSDDISLPHRFELQARYLEEHPDVGLVGGDAYVMDVSGRVYATRTYPREPDQLRRVIICYNPFLHSATMMRREIVMRFGGYPFIPWAEDYALWFMILRYAEGATIPEFLVKYRIDSVKFRKSVRNKLRGTIHARQFWLYEPGFRSLAGLFRHFLETMMVLLPESLVYWLFIWKVYRKVPHS